MTNNFSASLHKPVMLKEVIDHLSVFNDGWYFDGTLGGAGYTKAIIAKGGKVLATDLDLAAINRAKQLDFPAKLLKLYHTSFDNILPCMEDAKIDMFDGAVLDLGVSIDQLKTSDRGFSFMLDGPLDMRMNQNNDLDAKFIINIMELKELYDIFKTYGEEPFAYKIAKKIIRHREKGVIETTTQLATIIESVIPKSSINKNPSTRVFQALRIFVNKELDLLEKALINIPHALKEGGRLVIVTFHSLEDRLVKNAFKEKGLESRNQLFAYKKCHESKKNEFIMKPVLKKFISPSIEEIKENPSSRSAKLRVYEKIKTLP